MKTSAATKRTVRTARPEPNSSALARALVLYEAKLRESRLLADPTPGVDNTGAVGAEARLTRTCGRAGAIGDAAYALVVSSRRIDVGAA